MTDQVLFIRLVATEEKEQPVKKVHLKLNLGALANALGDLFASAYISPFQHPRGTEQHNPKY